MTEPSSEGPPKPATTDERPTNPAAGTAAERRWINPRYFDLRDRTVCQPDERAQDCAPIFAHPATVIGVFVLGMLLLMAGLWMMVNYSLGRTRSVTNLWRVTIAIFLLVTVLGLIVPYRLRFSTGNLYGLLTIALLIEYSVFICAFPVQVPSDEHVEAAEFVREFMRQNKPAADAMKRSIAVAAASPSS